MAKKALSDKESKRILLEDWPETTRLWTHPVPGGRWIRAQPKKSGDGATTPRLCPAGIGEHFTQSDGLWVALDLRNNPHCFADCVVVEVCGTLHNLADKRSRITPRTYSLMLHLPQEWMNEKFQGNRTRLGLAAPGSAPASEDMMLPVRFVRVLFAVENSVYQSIRSCIFEAHEYVCPHSSFKSFTSKKMQEFLQQMDRDRQFYAF